MMTPDKLMELDKTFCRAVQAGGARAWASYFASAGIMIVKNGENPIGREAIYQTMHKFFEEPSNRLIWQPESAQLSDDHTLGYTFGSYTRTRLDKDNRETVETGRYTTVWRLQSNGNYLIELDTGN